MTHWTTIIGKRAPPAPLLDIELTHMDAHLIRAKAQVLHLPREYQRSHGLVVSEFQNASHWPKHLLVRYRWDERSSINDSLPLYISFLFGFLMAAVVILPWPSVSPQRRSNGKQQEHRPHLVTSGDEANH
ncbi:hypothetical protein WJX74_005195 [Apatococcus lobatus]|uniref:Uncharacterized protein n=1 Tax=Apatococcus lobatus TaxID=904363 RepID=A0AAW1QXQ8_9CHLO